MNVKNILLTGLLCCVQNSFQLYCRIYEARSDTKFYDCLMKKPLAVVMFHGDDKIACGDKLCKASGVRLEKIFATVARQGYYMKGGVIFIKAHAKYDSICELIRSFSIPELPAFILFKNGLDLRDEAGKTIMLIGCPSCSELEQFIREYLEEDIDRNIEHRAKELAKLREAERWSYLWYRPWFCGGWPYYGCGAGWGCGCGGPCRPYWGCSVGCGFGNCCW